MPPHASVSALHQVLLGNHVGAADYFEGDTFPLDPFENRFTLLKTKTLKTLWVVNFHVPIFGKIYHAH